ncbi:uncharacterized protein LOC144716213 [Wolffia australiana]
MMDEEEGMRCTRHGRGDPEGGICALCLQEKLSRLLSAGGAARPCAPQSPPSPTPGAEPRPDSPGGATRPRTAAATVRFLPFLLSRLAVSKTKTSAKKTASSASGGEQAAKRKGRWPWLRAPSSAVSDNRERASGKGGWGLESQGSGRRLARSRSAGCGVGGAGSGEGGLQRVESQREYRAGAAVRTRARGGWGLLALATPVRAFRAAGRHRGSGPVDEDGTEG